MNQSIRQSLDNLKSQDDKIRYSALQLVLKATDSKVDWVYEEWDSLLDALAHANSYQRSIAAMVLCNLAKSDHENRLARDLERVLALIDDEKFVTSRQCLQSIWKAGVGNKSNRKRIVDHLAKHDAECRNAKHHNLVRQDILQSLRNLYDEAEESSLKARALELIGTEDEAKYRKKYESIWLTSRGRPYYS